MHRFARISARSTARRQLLNRAPSTRTYSSSTAPPSPLRLAIGVVAAGGIGFYVVSKVTIFEKSKPKDVPSIGKIASESNIDISTPVKVVDLATANAKIREQSKSFVFTGKDGLKGRVDLVRLESNSPTEDEWDIRVGDGVNGSKTLFTGVYDGHAGWATSTVLRKALIPYVSSALDGVAKSSSPETIDDTIMKAFTRLDENIMTTAIKAVEAGHESGSGHVVAALAPAIAGSCALLTMYDTVTSTLRTAVTGDSRAVLGSWSAENKNFETQVLSKDQTGFNEDEVKKLDKEHPGEQGIIDPKTGRLMGIAITRGFGDHRWKWSLDLIKKAQDSYFSYGPRPDYKSPPYMTAEPVVTTRQVSNEDLVILASDGLWDVMSNEDAVECVSRWVTAKKTDTPEKVEDTKSTFDGSYKATPEHFAIEDLDSAAVCLLKNALGGRRRGLFTGLVGAYTPVSRYARDDITIQVVFFNDPHKK